MYNYGRGALRPASTHGAPSATRSVTIGTPNDQSVESERSSSGDRVEVNGFVSVTVNGFVLLEVNGFVSVTVNGFVLLEVNGFVLLGVNGFVSRVRLDCLVHPSDFRLSPPVRRGSLTPPSG